MMFWNKKRILNKFRSKLADFEGRKAMLLEICNSSNRMDSSSRGLLIYYSGRISFYKEKISQLEGEVDREFTKRIGVKF
jgi:hypothetical protein